MRVVCVKNTISTVPEAEVRERLRRSIHLDGPIDGLAIGQEYPVQAVEERDGGLWFYLHTDPSCDYPYSYPAEMFDLRDSIIPPGWCVRLRTQYGTVRCKRITFSAWANDDHYYERLVEGDAAAVSEYRRLMIRGTRRTIS